METLRLLTDYTTLMLGLICGTTFDNSVSQEVCFQEMSQCVTQKIEEEKPETMLDKRMFWIVTDCTKVHILPYK